MSWPLHSTNPQPLWGLYAFTVPVNDMLDVSL
eukprot:CAMPEP_0181478944 /NCGR_PEP_ID=MMETSP1110-20121109/43021_1 /TAXON_ID=174948 /ORGANISM="Symbiodinium sp., Strain CCMP421" /LENGTH=31 /DNA_ID= /DNA_START= /DNA_END= /DNA_ORIENTATION=